MLLDIIEDPVSIEERKTRRKRLRRKRRIQDLLILSLVPVVLIIVYLFSPLGPLDHVIFSSGEKVGKKTDLLGKIVDNKSQEVNPSSKDDAGSETKPSRVEKQSDPTPPAIAIVVDDVEPVGENLNQWLDIDAPLSFSVFPFGGGCAKLADQFYQAGYQVMMHIPTENPPPYSFSGQGQLETGMDRETAFETLDDNLPKVPHVVGINNHQGGEGCNDLQLMIYECEWAKRNGLFVVDSKSSTESKVSKAATKLEMDRKCNQVFLDYQNDPSYIRSAMRELAGIAREDGSAIGICHFGRPNTPRIVGEMIQVLRSEGVHFAFAQNVNN